MRRVGWMVALVGGVLVAANVPGFTVGFWIGALVGILASVAAFCWRVPKW